MTFKPIDEDTLADDYPFGWQLRYAVDSLRACIDDRQPCGSHAYVGSVAKELPVFSTSSDRWRHIPVLWYPEEGVATLTARVRLDVSQTSGKMRLRVGDRVGSTVALSTGTQTATASIDVSGIGLSASTPSQSPVVVGIEFLSERVTPALGTLELVGTLDGHQLAISDTSSILGSPSTPVAGHYEMTLSESDATPFAHVQTIIEADHHSDFEYDFWLDRSVADDAALRPFSGEAPQTAGPQESLFSLTTFSVDGWELEAEGDGSAYYESVRRQVGSGQGAMFRSVNELNVAAQDAVARTMRWVVCAPTQPGGYGIGARVDDVDDTAIGGGILKYREDALGVDVAICFIAAAREGEGRNVQREFEVEIENLTAGGTTTRTALLTQDARVGRSTGYAYGVGATASSEALEDWSTLDLGLPVDLGLLEIHRFTAGFVTLPSDNDLLLVRVYSSDGNVAVPCLLVRERFA